MSTRQYQGYAGSRLSHRANGTLGIVSASEKELLGTYRKKELEQLDAYYEGRQYTGMPSWEDGQDSDGEYLKVRERAPRLNYNFAKILASRLTSKLLGKKNFPQLKVEDDPQTAEYFNLILSTSQLRSKLMEPMRRTINTGSCFVRFSIIGGKWKVQHYLSKWCFPEFDVTGELEKLVVKYVYDDLEDLDENNKPIKKWYKLSLGKDQDIKYDNPVFEANAEPKFKVEGKAMHGLGFVQGEWFVSSEDSDDIDGATIIGDILGFIDELNYSLSQTSQAVQYNQDPQLVFSNMDEDDMESIVRSSLKAWTLGREGKAEFLESDLTGVETAIVFRDKIKLNIQDISRIVMLDPEKMAAHAQSGRSMEVLHGPFVELIEEMQPQLEKHLKNLIIKMSLANGFMSEASGIAPVILPPDYKPKSMNLTFSFPDVFAQTAEDLQKKVAVAVNAANASLISRESMTRWLAKDFDIVDVEEEIKKIEGQPVINPFGAF